MSVAGSRGGPRPELRDVPGTWDVDASRDLHRDDWVMALREDVVRRPGDSGPDAETHRRLVLEHPGAVVVLAVDDTDPDAPLVCCLRQYRHGGPGWFIELPAGLMDAEGEDPQVTAARELREEAELAATDWRELLTLRPSVGISSEVQRIYLARGLSHAGRGDFELHGEEAEMTVFWAPYDQLLAAVLDGSVATSPLVSAVVTYDLLRRRGDL